MKERRKQERKNLVAYTQVFDLFDGVLIGYLGDLSLQGAMAICEKSIQPDTSITIGIDIPELPDVRATRMSLSSRVAWCEPDLSPQFYNIGFEFKEITPQQKQLIETIIQHYEFRRGAQSFPPAPEGK
ncbi:MAG TPA: PilZ domain-containing protein [Anaerolineales bacterium]|nr:PilZ domain-containing protein [Anaerolineales bacterium]HNN13390.1 PilZ domain-containing protein [Anaerolineales bacterium]